MSYTLWMFVYKIRVFRGVSMWKRVEMWKRLRIVRTLTLNRGNSGVTLWTKSTS